MSVAECPNNPRILVYAICSTVKSSPFSARLVYYTHPVLDHCVNIEERCNFYKIFYRRYFWSRYIQHHIFKSFLHREHSIIISPFHMLLSLVHMSMQSSKQHPDLTYSCVLMDETVYTFMRHLKGWQRVVNENFSGLTWT